jgi:hypothetical protein
MGEETRTQARPEGALEADGRGVALAPGARLVDASRRKRAGAFSASFPTVLEKGVFVDKSLLVRDVLDDDTEARLLCRPRRFGKTLAMSMLQDFLECAPCADPGARSRFERLDIWEADGGRWREHLGRYPVVALSLRDAEGSTWEDILGAIKGLVSGEFERHRYLLDGDALSDEQRAKFLRLAAGRPEPGELAGSLGLLTELLHRHHGRKAVVLIDEYDAPITSAMAVNGYNKAIRFVRPFLSGALKDNVHLEKGLLTGVQRVSKESIFSGLNNVDVNTPLDQGSDERFGFTQAEVEALASYLDHPESVPTLREWYDGYRFGDADIYNPWSVLSFFAKGRRALPYWNNTSSNGILAKAAGSADRAVRSGMLALLEPGATVSAPVDPNVAYGELDRNPSGIWSVLYMSGYLTTEDTDATAAPDGAGDPDRKRPLRVPNREVRHAYRRDVLAQVQQVAGGRDKLRALYEGLAAGDDRVVGRELATVVRDCASYYDLVAEGPCHAMLLGLLVGMDGYANPVSNREAGHGRPDIQVVPDTASQDTPALTIEVKFEKGADDARLAGLAREALAQAESLEYDAALEGAPRVRWGAAFSGKHVAVACERLGF